MILYCKSHSTMFSSPNRHSSQTGPFNPYNYGTSCPTQTQTVHYSGSQMASASDLQDQNYQQNNVSWHPAPVYPVSTCGRSTAFDDWGQTQGSPLSASPCSHVQNNNQNLGLAPGTSQTFYGQTFQYRQLNTSPVADYAATSHVISDLGHHPSPDTTLTVSSDPESPSVISVNTATVRPQPARSPYEWMKKPSYQNQQNPGKTRTKDKYRVVYTDHQRLELEKEFHYSRYITIRRKSELASMLGLSERQVKIWFQNRRAKERKQAKKREEIMQKEKDQVHQIHAANTLAAMSKNLLNLETGPCS